MSVEWTPRDNRGRIVLRSGNPVMSDRSYHVRGFEADYMDRVPQGQAPIPLNRGEKRVAVLFEDIETGIITSDVEKFEKWMKRMEERGE